MVWRFPLWRWVCSLALLAGLLPPLIAVAQDDDDGPVVVEDFITYGETVEGTITARGIYDLWRFYAQAGDMILVTMAAADGLAPLVGIASIGGDIIARSDVALDGSSLPDAGPNETITLEFQIPEEGRYTVVPTRVGNLDGTTTGSYSLTLELTGSAPGRIGGDLPEVTFRCGAEIVTTAAVLEFLAAEHMNEYRISVYGLDGFRPLIRATIGDNDLITDCGADAQHMGGDRVILPDGETFALPEDSTVITSGAQYGLRGVGDLGRMNLTIGSIDGSAGRYVIVVEGFTLAYPGEEHVLDIRPGPLTKSTEMLVYMMRDGVSRIDPYIYQVLITGEDEMEYTEIACNDAGLRGCEEVPALTGAGVIFNNGKELLGGRFDAGLRLDLASGEVQRLFLNSRARNARGDYAVLILGELPSGE
jgi:hypothetical protein